MKTEKSNLFTTGAFAALCDTTKETLRHYNNIGILKPEKIGDNGYQYYSPTQFFDFYLITSLKRAGSPLSDIKRYMEHPDAGDFLRLLYKQQQNLFHEKMMLERMEQLIRQSIDSIELALSDKPIFEQPEIIFCEEEYFIVIEAPAIGGSSEADYIDCLTAHVHYCMQNDIGAEFRINSIVLKEDFLKGKYQPNYFCSKIAKPVTSDRLFVKPKGCYVSILYKGSTDVSPAYEKLREYITQNNFTVCGNAYEYELAGFLSTGDRKDYFCKVHIEINRQPYAMPSF